MYQYLQDTLLFLIAVYLIFVLGYFEAFKKFEFKQPIKILFKNKNELSDKEIKFRFVEFKLFLFFGSLYIAANIEGFAGVEIFKYWLLFVLLLAIIINGLKLIKWLKQLGN